MEKFDLLFFIRTSEKRIDDKYIVKGAKPLETANIGLYNEVSKMSIEIRKEVLLKAKSKLIKEHESKISTLDKYIQVLEKSIINENDTVEVISFKLYMQLDNVAKVANAINNVGYRIKTTSHKGERKYNSNDITAIITNKEAKVDKELKEVVQEIQKMNYGKISKRWF